MNARHLWLIGFALVACSQAPAPEPHGLRLAVAPLELVGIDVACYDLLVAGLAGTVWSQGDPATDADDGDTSAVCSDVFGNGPGGDISYVGPCDASEEADSDPDQPGVQNAVTVWFDGLYTGSSSGGLTPIPGTTQTITGFCATWMERSFCGFPDLPDFVEMLPIMTCTQDSQCVFDVEAPSWQDPCGPTGCTLHFDCVENQDTPVVFNFTVMRSAMQGFFDVAVNFEDVFCSAKYDTCYDVGTADERPIELLFGPDGERDHTGVMGLACAGDPNSDAETVLHRSEIWVWCNDWDTYFVLDPTQGQGNVVADASTSTLPDIDVEQCQLLCEDYGTPAFHLWVEGWTRDEQDVWCTSLGDCSDWATIGFGSVTECQAELALCAELTGYRECQDDCIPTPATIRYATYWGTEELDCGSGPGSCNKVYWNLAFDLEHLKEQGLFDCHLVTIATASTAGSGVIVDGELAVSNSYYPIIDFGGMNGDWVTGLPLVGSEDIPCVTERLNADGSLVHTDYAETGDFSLSESSEVGFNGPIQTDYWTWLCFSMTQGDAAPAADPECLAHYCGLAESWGSVPAFCRPDAAACGGTADDPEVHLVDQSVADQADPLLAGSAAAILATVPAECPIVLHFTGPGAYTVAGALRLPPWATLRVDDGAWLDVSGGLTVDGPIDAGPWRIVTGAGVVDGAPLIDAALAEWFGAVADDGLDDHTSVQAALGFFPVVRLQAGAYDVGATIVLATGQRIEGPPSAAGTLPAARLRATPVFPDTGGFHPTRVLESAPGAANIALVDVTLDGNRHAPRPAGPPGRIIWHYPEGDTLARFEGVTGLVLERFGLTAYESNWGSNDQRLFSAMTIIDATDVRLSDVTFTDSRVEGISIYTSSGVTVERLRTENSTVWTPLHALRVQDFTLVDSSISEDVGMPWTGSTVNLAVRQALIANNRFLGGQGLDVGDEGSSEGLPGLPPGAFGMRDIVIADNEIETTTSGVYCVEVFPGDEVSNLEISGNTITVHRSQDPANNFSGIWLREHDGVSIVGNTITSAALAVPGDAAFMWGVRLTGRGDGLEIRGNTMSGVDAGVGFIVNDHTGPVTIAENDITCLDTSTRVSWQGASTGVYVYRNALYNYSNYDSLVIHDNDVSAVGGWVTIIDDNTGSATQAFVDALTVTGNRFLPATGSERNVSDYGNASATTVTGNTPSWVNP